MVRGKGEYRGTITASPYLVVLKFVGIFHKNYGFS
jgi:hypothetical protein